MQCCSSQTAEDNDLIRHLLNKASGHRVQEAAPRGIGTGRTGFCLAEAWRKAESSCCPQKVFLNLGSFAYTLFAGGVFMCLFFLIRKFDSLSFSISFSCLKNTVFNYSQNITGVKRNQ